MTNAQSDGDAARDDSKLQETDKEKTKLRERQRRAITTKIFAGLRKHGGYNLPPRADINDVLRALAAEAGWVIEADGTTHRNRVRLVFPKLRCNVCSQFPVVARTFHVFVIE